MPLEASRSEIKNSLMFTSRRGHNPSLKDQTEHTDTTLHIIGTKLHIIQGMMVLSTTPFRHFVWICLAVTDLIPFHFQLPWECSPLI